MSSLFDICQSSAYPSPMIKSRVHSVVVGINRLFDLFPEPLVLRAMEDHSPARRARH
jgi:hypothetical protein